MKEDKVSFNTCLKIQRIIESHEKIDKLSSIYVYKIPSYKLLSHFQVGKLLQTIVIFLGL